MGLKEVFFKFISEYGDVYNKVWNEQKFKNPLGGFISHSIPLALMDTKLINKSMYQIKASYGTGKWTKVPWIAIFDTRITTSAQQGEYIVYLLNKDTKTLYLTFNQATYQKDINHLEMKAKDIRKMMNLSVEHKEIISGSDGYDKACICGKSYRLNTLDENLLQKDLEHYLDIYKRYHDIYYGTNERAEQEVVAKEKKMNEKSKIVRNHMTIKETIKEIKKYIASKGFSYGNSLIENFYLSLKSKPFVILAGTSGTGKTKLVKLFAEAIGANYKLVSVRPDWSDSSDLFGHVNLKNEFVPGAIIDYVKRAELDSGNLYFLCLDEMNLARVEYYLSDFLSIIETRHRSVNGIVTDEIILDKAAEKKYGKVILPDNLYVIGTVNMDETTFPFSKKVLDRANTIEFSYVDLVPDFEEEQDSIDPVSQKNEFLVTEYITLKADTDGKDRELIVKVCEELQDINMILQKANAHVGYRVRDEIVFYMLNNNNAELLNYEEAFDFEIMQKILPRIQGSSGAVKEMLCELFKKFAGDYTGLSQASISEQMQEYINGKTCKYRRSAKKICYMMRRFEEDGFTSYWL